MLCQYKNALGKIGEGVHSFRISNISIVDVLLTILLAYIIHIFTPQFTFISVLLWTFLLGIFLHHIFCVKTTVDKFLFGN